MSKRNMVILILLTLAVCLVMVAPAVAEKDKGDQEKGWLGVYIQDVTSDIKEAMDLESKRGVLVRDVVEDSPAEEAGIEQEDVIIKFSGKKVGDSSNLTKLIRSSSPGEKVELIILRDGKEKTIKVKLGKRPKSGFSYQYEFEPFLGDAKVGKSHTYSFSFFSGSRIGVKVQDMTKQLGQYFGVEDGEGALITEVEEDMPAHKAGLEAGDVIVEADGDEINDTEELRDLISDKEEGDKVEIKVIRDRKSMSFKVEVEEGEEWLSSDLGNFKRLELLPKTPDVPKILWEGEYSSELEEEMEDLKEELEQLKEELQELREKIR